jgi:hypothetical protein
MPIEAISFTDEVVDAGYCPQLLHWDLFPVPVHKTGGLNVHGKLLAESL